ncbi:class I SAM-dependent methyltransferase [Chloroflexota bacterium]
MREQWYREFYDRKQNERLDTSDAESNVPRLVKTLHIVTERQPTRILDIGCGDGQFTSRLFQVPKVKEIYGVDIVENHVDMARARGIKAYKIDVDSDNLPFKSGFFDAIVCGEVIEHLFDPDHLLDEIYRVLSNTGFCVLTTPNLAALYNRICLLFGFQPFYTSVSSRNDGIGKPMRWFSGGGGHIRVFTYRAFKEILISHSFKIIKTMGSSPHNTNRTPTWINTIERVISFFPSLSSTPIFIIRK